MEEDLSKQLKDLSVESDGSQTENRNETEIDDSQQEFHDESSANCNLIVNYLPHDIDDSALRDLFVQYGDIIMTKVVRDKNTKKSLGYGFVKFLKEDDAVFAIDKMNGFSLGHKNLKVSIARPPSLEIRNCKLYVTNLPKEYTEREVVALFKEFGDIIECRVLKDRNSRSNKGVAFVQFNLKSQANSALSLNGCQLEGSSRGLVVKYAEDQHKKKEMSRLQQHGGNSPINAVNGAGVYGPDMKRGGNGVAGGFSALQPNNGGRNHNGNGRSHPFEMQHMNASADYPQHHQPLLHHHQQQQQQPPPQAFYYQQPLGLSGGYDGGVGSPLQMMSPLNSPQLSVYLPGGSSFGAPLDYSPSNHSRPVRGRKAYPLDIPPMDQQQQQMTGGGWYGTMPPHLSFLNSPQIGLSGQPLSPLGNLSHLIASGSPMLGSPVMGGGGAQNLMQMRQSAQHFGLGGLPASPMDSPQQPHQPAMYSGSVTLNVVNLPTQADVALLHDLFSPYGRILSAQIDVDAAAQSRDTANGGHPPMCSGRGRVQMAGLPQAEYAAQALNGAVITDNGIPIQVSLSYH